MKKQYTNPQCEYWCYVSGKLCNAPVDLYAKSDDPGTPGGSMVPSSGNTGPQF